MQIEEEEEEERMPRILCLLNVQMRDLESGRAKHAHITVNNRHISWPFHGRTWFAIESIDSEESEGENQLKAR